jgi:secernin
MASDLVVALGRAAVDGITLFAANHYGRLEQSQELRVLAGGTHPLDEHVRTTYLRLPQARRTYTVLGQQPEGSWGLVHGVNENHVAIGLTGWHSRMPGVGGGLSGTDLTRLALERSHTALQATDVLTDLISRHGQCPEGETHAPADSVFLVADRQEAFVVEAAGPFWAIQECRQVRVVTEVAMIRQDWQRISPGLSSLAIENGWWNGDGSKLDFAGCLDAQAPSHATARRRWGRATLALEQQSGAIDAPFLRRMLLDHHDASAALRTHRPSTPLASSFLTALAGADEPALAWCALGPPRVALFFPLWLDGELPAAFHSSDGPGLWQQTQRLRALADDHEVDARRLREVLERLQATFEEDVETLLPRARQWKRQGDQTRLCQQVTALMQRHVDQFAAECRALEGVAEHETVPVGADEFVSFIS